MKFIQLEIADTFEIAYEITMKNINDFQCKMDEFLVKSRNCMILDLDKVMYLNNSALGIIAHAVMRAKQAGKELVISGVKPPISEIFDIVNFSTFTKLFLTREEAVDYFCMKM